MCFPRGHWRGPALTCRGAPAALLMCFLRRGAMLESPSVAGPPLGAQLAEPGEGIKEGGWGGGGGGQDLKGVRDITIPLTSDDDDDDDDEGLCMRDRD